MKPWTTGSVSGAVSNLKYECGKSPSVFKQAWPTERVQLLSVKRLGSLSQRGRGLGPHSPPSFIIPFTIPCHYDQHQMLTIPGQRSQSMLGSTKADRQPIGSTLLTACNLLMWLARPQRAGVRADGGVCPPPPLWCGAAFSLWNVLPWFIPIVAAATAAAPVCPQEAISQWQLLISH